MYTVEECCAELSGQGYRVIDTEPYPVYNQFTDGSPEPLPKREVETVQCSSCIISEYAMGGTFSWVLHQKSEP